MSGSPRSYRFWSSGLLVGILVVGLCAVAYSERPDLYSSAGFSRAVYERDGRLLRLTTAPDDHYRVFAPVDEISRSMIDATLLYEDRHFWWHPGFNPVALAKAATGALFRAGKARGASTLTMQLARLHWNLKTRTPWGKLVQIFYATVLEWHLSKEEILEAYLNLAPYGGNVAGVAAASLIYFDKRPAQLSLAESMALSVMPQFPAARRPTAEGLEPQSLTRARRRLASAWRKEHPENVANQLSLERPLKMRTLDKLQFEAPHLTTMLLLEGDGAKEIDSTLDSRLQRLVERRVDSYVRRHGDQGIDNAAVLLVDHQEMEALAAVGSADFFNEQIHGQVNGVTARRSPGSTLKPLVYGLGLDRGLIHSETILKDTPVWFAGYTPHNFDGEFLGPLSATDALVRSRNVPAIALAAQLGSDGLFELLGKAGVSKLRGKDAYGLSPVLGGIEMTMDELARLYAMLAGGGVVRPIAYRRVQKEASAAGLRLLSPEAAFLTLKMLEQNPRPRQRFAESWLRDPGYVAWKTGTSPGSRDGWSVGVAGRFVLVVWVGQFAGGASPSYVGRADAAPLFFEIVDALGGTERLDALGATGDLAVERVPVCAVSGMIPGSHCSGRKESWFIPGKSPIAKCDVHRVVSLDPSSGLRLCDDHDPNGVPRVFEFWPSDLARIFKEAGLPRRSPPPFARACRARAQGARALATAGLAIVSPRRSVVYALRPERLAKERIGFSATTDDDTGRLYWFVDQSHVGSTSPGQTLFWKPEIGNFTVRVVDDRGRFDNRRLKIELAQ